MEDLISVIVPIYNVEKYLDRCINSIINQTYKNLEIILVDDGSPDNCGKMCDDYSKKDSRIKVIHKENAGLGFARNSGMDVMTGKYFSFIDSDDYVDVNHIENMYLCVKKYNLDACICGYNKVYSDRIEKHENEYGLLCFFDENVKNVIEKMSGALPNGTDFIQPSVCKCLFSSEIANKNNIRFVSERKIISEDLIFDLNFYSKCQRIAKIDDCTYYYCDNFGSLTTKYNPNRFLGQKKLYEYLIEFMKNNNLLDTTKIRIQTNFISNVRHCIRLENTFKNVNGKKNARNNIKRICQDKLVEDIFKTYPNKQVKFLSRIFNLCIKNKIYFLLNILSR